LPKPSLFTITDDGQLIPEPPAGSGWGADHMRGMAISGALARATEQTVHALARTDLQPARWTVDLFRVAKLKPTTTTTTVKRAGRRLCLVEAELLQDGLPVARSSGLFLSRSPAPSGSVWAPATEFEPPCPDSAQPREIERLYRADGGRWTLPADFPPDDRRKCVWQYAIDIVDGEPLTGFQVAASIADIANAATNLGSNGLEFVNADVTLSLSRVPAGTELGMLALARTEHGGIATGTAQVFDRNGPLGTATVSALANQHNAVDLRRHGSLQA
jgi:hypothetical protein